MSQNTPNWTQITDNPYIQNAQNKISNFRESNFWGKYRASKFLFLFKNKDVLDMSAEEHSSKLYSEQTRGEQGLIKSIYPIVLPLE